MRHVLIFVSAEWTLAGVSLLHLVKVVVEPAVSCNDVECGSIVSSVIRVVFRSRIILACLLPRIILMCLGPLRFHSFWLSRETLLLICFLI